MLTELEKARDKWGGAKSAIDNWLNERQQVVVLYNELSKLIARSPNLQPEQLTIQNFCQVLMDYVSAGHFEVYERIVSECEEHGSRSMHLAKRLYPKIARTTDSVLAFNDKYGDNQFEEEMRELDHDWSELGQQLVTRMELEDEMIHTLHTNH